MDTIVHVHGHAYIHELTKKQIVKAFHNREIMVDVEGKNLKDGLPQFYVLGFIERGEPVEMVVVEITPMEYLVIHAIKPPTKKFLRVLQRRREGL